MRGCKSAFAVLSLVLLLPAASAYYDYSEQGGFEAEARYHSPIVFIPGIMGSTLVDADRNFMTGELWIGTFGKDRSKLILDENGKPIAGSNIQATQTVRSKYNMIASVKSTLWDWSPSMSAGDVYEGFFGWMDDQKIYTYNGKQNNYGWLGRAYFDEPYDFRLDNREQVPILKKKVDDVLDKTKSDKVILVAHSMGGYQARLFAEKYPDKVKAIIFLSSPHHGAPRAYQTFTKGYNFGVPMITDQHLWEVGGNWPAGYQLMPDYTFISGEAGTWSLDESFYGSDWISGQLKASIEKKLAEKGVVTEEQARQLITGMLKSGVPNHDLAKNMQAFRQQYNAMKLSKDIRVEIINGDNTPTTQIFKATKEDLSFQYLKEYKTVSAGRAVTQVPVYETVSIPGWKLLNLENVDSPAGDGTVADKGLQWENSGAAPSSVTSEHMKVPGNADADKLLGAIIEDINHDKRDLEWIQKMRGIAASNIASLVFSSKGQVGESAKEISQFYAQESLKEGGTKEDLGHWKGEIEGRAKKMVLQDLLMESKITHINVIAKNAGNYDDKNKDFKAYLVVLGASGVQDAGIGTVSPSEYEVVINDPGVFDAIINERMSVKDAYKAGALEVHGTLFQGFLLKAASLASKFITSAVEDEKRAIEERKKAEEEYKKKVADSEQKFNAYKLANKACGGAYPSCFDQFGKQGCQGTIKMKYNCIDAVYHDPVFDRDLGFRKCEMAQGVNCASYGEGYKCASGETEGSITCVPPPPKPSKSSSSSSGGLGE